MTKRGTGRADHVDLREKRELEGQRQKFGTVDERFMKRAEELLFGELAAALGIPREEVPRYIEARLERPGEDGGDAEA